MNRSIEQTPRDQPRPRAKVLSLVALAALVLIVGSAAVGALARPAVDLIGAETSPTVVDGSPGVVAATSAPGTSGYWELYADGTVVASGGAIHRGHFRNLAPGTRAVDIAATPTGRGYWVAASDGGVFTFGDAGFHGSMGAVRLNQPVVAIAGTPSGRGYWLAASDGGVFTFGDAGFHGSMGGVRLNRPIVDMDGTVSGRGYWLAAADGGVFTFGDAGFHGSLGAASGRNVVGITRHGSGYALVEAAGTIVSFGTRFATEPVPARSTLRTSGPRPTDTIAREVFSRINAERTARGLAALRWDNDLAGSAQGWSDDMAESGFRHADLGRAISSLPGVSQLGENIYWGEGPYSTSGSTFVSMMGSAGHRNLMLAPGFSIAGVGVACDGATAFVTLRIGVESGHVAVPGSSSRIGSDAHEGGTSCQ